MALIGQNSGTPIRAHSRTVLRVSGMLHVTLSAQPGRTRRRRLSGSPCSSERSVALTWLACSMRKLALATMESQSRSVSKRQEARLKYLALSPRPSASNGMLVRRTWRQRLESYRLAADRPTIGGETAAFSLAEGNALRDREYRSRPWQPMGDAAAMATVDALGTSGGRRPARYSQ